MPHSDLSKISLTESVSGESALGELAGPGVYGGGLLTVPTVEDAEELIEAFEWDFVREFELLAHNGFGDLFLRPTEGGGVYYFWTQWGQGRQIAGDPQQLFDATLEEPANRERFLETRAFAVVSKRLGSLRYGNVFTLNPIRALGGDGNLENCAVGRLDAYLAIISQSFEPE